MAPEVESHAALRPVTLLRLEGLGPLLGVADEHHALGSFEVGTSAIGDIVLSLPVLELHQRRMVRLGEALDVVDEAFAHRSEQGGRRNGIAPMVPEEVAELAGGLKCWDVAVDVDAIDAGD